MELAREPDGRLAAEVLPRSILRALAHVFAHGIEGVMLVGGTALAGFYAGHRRSDDLDLFARDGEAHEATVRAVRSLTEIGAAFAEERSSARFHHAACRLDGHDFTVQVVLDPNLFAVGTAHDAGGIAVASLETLLELKAATLVSRASEKDLYDLDWLVARAPGLDAPTLVALGKRIDGGMSAEGVLISLLGSVPAESACGFSLRESPREVLAKVERVRRGLIDGFERVARSEPAPPIAELIRKLRG